LVGIQKRPNLNSREDFLENIMDLLFQQGLEKAMEVYDKNS
jgi:hypothetical protein